MANSICPQCGNPQIPSKWGGFWCPKCAQKKKEQKQTIKEQDQGDLIIARLNNLEKMTTGEFQKINERITEMAKFFAERLDK